MNIKLIILSLFIKISQQTILEQYKLGISDEDLKLQLQKHVENQYKFTIQDFNTLFTRGYYLSATYIYENSIEQDDSIQTTFQKQFRILLNEQKRDLDSLNQNILAANKPIQVVEPALQWAQSPQQVFLGLKLALRWSSPACMKCERNNIQITNSTIFAEYEGISSHQPTKYKLNITLENNIDIENSKWEEDSVGGLTFTLQKAKSEIWKYLTDEKRKIQVWYEMSNQNSKYMEEWGDLIDKIQLEQEQEEIRQIKEAKKRERADRKRREKENPELKKERLAKKRAEKEKIKQQKLKLQEEEEEENKKQQEEENKETKGDQSPPIPEDIQTNKTVDTPQGKVEVGEGVSDVKITDL